MTDVVVAPAEPQATAAEPQAPAVAPEAKAPSAPPALPENWKDFIPEDFKGRHVYDTFGNDISSLLRHVGHQDTLIGKKGMAGMISVPGPDANKTEIEMFNKAIGVPETPQGYENAIKAAIPKEMTSILEDTESVSAFEEVMHKAGATPQVAAAAMSVYASMVAKAQQDMKDNPLPFYEEILPLVQPIYANAFKAELQKRWGDNYQSREHMFKSVVFENTTEGPERDLLMVRIEQDPLIADLLATIKNKHFTSGMGPDTSTGSPVGAVNVDQKMQEINAQLTGQLKRSNPEKYKALLSEKERLYNTRYKE